MAQSPRLRTDCLYRSNQQEDDARDGLVYYHFRNLPVSFATSGLELPHFSIDTLYDNGYAERILFPYHPKPTGCSVEGVMDPEVMPPPERPSSCPTPGALPIIISYPYSLSSVFQRVSTSGSHPTLLVNNGPHGRL
jgi:hypothetical protein